MTPLPEASCWFILGLGGPVLSLRHAGADRRRDGIAVRLHSRRDPGPKTLFPDRPRALEILILEVLPLFTFKISNLIR